MFTRFANFSIKIVRFSRVLNNLQVPAVSTLYSSQQKRSYATDKPDESLLACNKFNYSLGTYADFIETYINAGNLDKALNTLKETCSKYPEYQLNPYKLARLVELMLNKNKNFGEIEAILMSHHSFGARYNIECTQLLHRLAATGKNQIVQQIFDALVKYNYINATIDTTAPLIRVYLKTKSYAEATDKYEYFANHHKFAPITSVLFNNLIRNNETDLLQRAFNVRKKLHGENDAWCYLAFGYIGCGHTKEAKEIFEQKYFDGISKYIHRITKIYLEKRDIDAAKSLLEATKNIECDHWVIRKTISQLEKQCLEMD